MNKIAFGLLIVFCLAVTLAWSAPPATFTWSAPAANSDGSPLTDLAGFRGHCGSSPGNYDAVVNIPGATVTSYLDDGTLVPDGAERYCAWTAYDTAGNESGYSNEVRLDFLAPGAPINLQWN